MQKTVTKDGIALTITAGRAGGAGPSTKSTRQVRDTEMARRYREGSAVETAMRETPADEVSPEAIIPLGHGRCVSYAQGHAEPLSAALSRAHNAAEEAAGRSGRPAGGPARLPDDQSGAGGTAREARYIDLFDALLSIGLAVFAAAIIFTGIMAWSYDGTEVERLFFAAGKLVSAGSLFFVVIMAIGCAGAAIINSVKS